MNIFFKIEPKYTLTLLHYICITVLAAVAAYYFFVPETPKQRGVVLSKEARAMLFTQQESGALFVAPQNRVEMRLREQPASISEAEAKIDTTPLVCFELSCTFRSSEEISDFQNELHRKRALGQTPRLDDLNIYARFRLFGNHALDADFVRRLMEEFNTLDPVGGRSTVFARLQDRGIIEESVL